MKRKSDFLFYRLKFPLLCQRKQSCSDKLLQEFSQELSGPVSVTVIYYKWSSIHCCLQKALFLFLDLSCLCFFGGFFNILFIHLLTKDTLLQNHTSNVPQTQCMYVNWQKWYCFSGSKNIHIHILLHVLLSISLRIPRGLLNTWLSWYPVHS